MPASSSAKAMHLSTLSYLAKSLNSEMMVVALMKPILGMEAVENQYST